MRFRASPTTARIPNSVLIYRADEFSFDVEPAPTGGFTSVLIDTLSLELDADGRVISIWGLCPYTRWKGSVLKPPPQAQFGDVIFVPDAPLVQGVSVHINGKNWPVFVDVSSGWVRVTGKQNALSSTEIMPGIIIDIAQQGVLSAVWLRPQKLPDLN